MPVYIFLSNDTQPLRIAGGGVAPLIKFTLFFKSVFLADKPYPPKLQII
jgi:hypothetical protein